MQFSVGYVFLNVYSHCDCNGCYLNTIAVINYVLCKTYLNFICYLLQWIWL